MSKPKTSAGLLLYRIRDGQPEVLIARMGGPFWAKKDAGAWSVIKGEYDENEDAYAAARREFEEETGTPPPQGATLELGAVRQRSGKLVTAWAIESDFDASRIESNTFTMEWPRGSGRQQAFPEIDRIEWFDLDTARAKLVSSQCVFLDALEEQLKERGA